MAKPVTNPHYMLISWNKHNQFWEKHMKSLSTREKPFVFSKEFKDLINSILSFDKTRRPSLAEILTHSWVNGPEPTEEEILKFFREREARLKYQKNHQKAMEKNYRRPIPGNENQVTKNYGYEQIIPRCRGSPDRGEISNLQLWTNQVSSADLRECQPDKFLGEFSMNHNTCMIDSDVKSSLHRI